MSNNRALLQDLPQDRLQNRLQDRLAALWARLSPTADGLFGIDLRALAALRIGLGFYLLGDLFDRAKFIEVHYTDFGVCPHQAVYLYDTDRWANMSPYMWVDGVVPVALLMAFAALLAVLLILGWRTRPVCILSYFMLCGIQSRNPMILHGADLLLRVLHFWMMLTPIGARWSLDGLAAQWRREGRAVPKRMLSFGTAGLLLQIVMMYWTTAAAKSGTEWRHDGTAVYIALSLQEYATPVGQWLRMQTALLKPATHLTWLLEAFGPAIAFFPWRTSWFRGFMAAVFIGFHLVLLNLCFDLGPFPYIATLAWIPFLPSGFWDWLEKAWARLPDGMHGATGRAKAFLVGLQSRIVDARIRSGKPTPGIRLRGNMRWVVAFLVVYMVIWNVRGLDWANRSGWIPSPIHFIARMLRLDQGWGMFAPKPLIEDGWFVEAAKLNKDSDYSLNPYTGASPIDWKRPVHLVSMYPNERWRKYIMNLWVLSNIGQRPFYCRWVCNNWNRVHHDADQMAAFQLYYMRTDIQPGYAESKPIKVKLWETGCFSPDAPTPPVTGKKVRPAEPMDRKMQWP